MFNKIAKRKDKEEGQAMVEFVLILPIFMMIMAIIFDFGWLFYNQIQLENCTRNAARVACVEYDGTCLPQSGTYDDAKTRRYQFNLTTSKTWVQASPKTNVEISTQEQLILDEVLASLPGSIKPHNNYSNDPSDQWPSNILAKVYIEYTYDSNCGNLGRYPTFKAKERYYGDVVVTVKANHRAITPLVGWGTSDGSTALERIISSQSVYKVEKLV